MADTSPGKVQALRAMFSQNSDPVIGLQHSNPKLGIHPWKHPISTACAQQYQSSQLAAEEKQKISPVNPSATRTILKTLQASELSSSHKNIYTRQNMLPKPVVGPKPAFLKQHQPFTQLPSTISQVPARKAITVSDKVTSSVVSNSNLSSSFVKGKPFCDTTLKSPSLRNLNLDLNGDWLCEQTVVSNSNKKEVNLCSKSIGSDNYICKSACKFRMLPPVDKIGPPPCKPIRPSHLKLKSSLLCAPLPKNYKNLNHNQIESIGLAEAQRKDSPTIPIKVYSSRPAAVLPSLSSSSSVSNDVFIDKHNERSKTLLEEIEELYGDTILDEEPVSPIPEYSAEEEALEQEELYIDAGDEFVCQPELPQKPKHPPPPPPFSYLEPVSSSFFPDELYQDATELGQEEFYEEMPQGPSQDDHYSNSRKEREKMKREELKRAKKCIKKFGISGAEIAIYSGKVKSNSRGGQNDLTVKKGEKVHILRIENNPPGKWLAKNKKGKCGFVELTNIEVDPDSVKSVMSEHWSSDGRRTSNSSHGPSSTSEDPYCEAYSDQGIYEMAY